MPKTVQQTVRFPAPPEELFDSYLDPARHAAITGQPAQISARPGGEFHAFDGRASGRIVAVIPKRLTGQTWRAHHSTKEGADPIPLAVFSGGRGDRVAHPHPPA